MENTPDNINQGYIKLFRSLLDWEWYDDINTFKLFIHCLLKANYEDTKWHGIEIKKGSFITGIYSLSKQLRLSQQQIRTSIIKLKSTNEITIKTTNKYSIIVVVNYEKYQNNNKQNNNQNNKQITNEQQTNNKLATTDNELKNLRNKENNINTNTLPFETIKELFNNECKELAKIQLLTNKRKQKIKLRWKELEEDIETFKKVFQNVKNSEFLNGKNDRDWKATFDWIFENENNIAKILEGNYNKNEKNSDSDLKKYEETLKRPQKLDEVYKKGGNVC